MPASTLFVPIAVLPREVRTAEAEADVCVGQIRLGETGEVALDLGTRCGFQTEVLAGTAPCAAADEVIPTGGIAGPVEVLFVEQDLTDEAGV